ncbi:hypothetical protein FOZ62_025522 [Perkinsus olseni]|uniref:Uncharacterized protein n=1 Tax=Perkinsus olseni TaxID=32597 RepID=A0A7J6SDP2_PEROL|nr:hypothetical protein FOZ62_025522 [Perkinsus olseni]
MAQPCHPSQPSSSAVQSQSSRISTKNAVTRPKQLPPQSTNLPQYDDDDATADDGGSPLERRMFMFFALAQFLQIGSYWLIRPVKSGLFARLVGDDKEALVRIILTPMLFFLLIGYNILIQSVMVSSSSPHNSSRIVGYLAAPFAVLFISSWFWMALFGLDNTPQAVGWILALASECMCPILVTLNWSIISESAKDYSSSAAASAFPMITMACQLGCLLGSSITNYLARTGAQTTRRGGGGDGFMNNNMRPDDDAINNYTALLPVLLCGLSLCGMWACMVKADECHAKDRSRMEYPVDDDLPLDRNDEEDEDWVAQYHHHNDDDGEVYNVF